jgi:hypothetical protein
MIKITAKTPTITPILFVQNAASVNVML